MAYLVIAVKLEILFWSEGIGIRLLGCGFDAFSDI